MTLAARGTREDDGRDQTNLLHVDPQRAPWRGWERSKLSDILDGLETMDDTDRELLLQLGANPRIPAQELARRLGISRQAVHHRMRVLADLGVYRGTTAAVSIEYLDAVPVVVFGPAEAASMGEILARLGESDLTRRVLVAAGNFVYAVGWLRDLSELEGYAEFVKRAVGMREPTVGIYSMDPRLMPPYTVDGIGKRKGIRRELSPLDLRIVAALADDARRPVAEVAAELGASSKTVRRHLDTMMAEGLVELWARIDEPLGGDGLYLVHLTLRDGADKVGAAFRLVSEYPFRDMYVRAFSNLPNLLVWVFWSGQLAAVREALAEVAEADDTVRVVPHFAIVERVYRTWRERPAAELHLRAGDAHRRRALHAAIPR